MAASEKGTKEGKMQLDAYYLTPRNPKEKNAFPSLSRYQHTQTNGPTLNVNIVAKQDKLENLPSIYELMSARGSHNSTNILGLGVNLQELKGIETARDPKSLRIARKRGSHVQDINANRRTKAVDKDGKLKLKMPQQVKDLMNSIDGARTHILNTPRENDYRALSSRTKTTRQVVPLENESHMPLQNQYMLKRDISEDEIKTEVNLS